MHPALGGGFGKGFKVIKGYDLVGDAYTGKNTPKPDSDPLDKCGAESGASGHGTHVSGIIAGYDKATVSILPNYYCLFTFVNKIYYRKKKTNLIFLTHRISSVLPLKPN